MLLFLIFEIICILFTSAWGQIQDPIVSTELGLIRGSVLKDRYGEDYFAFRGIRYAESPEGNLRWQPPVPVSSWTHIYDARVDSPACPQAPLPTMQLSEMSEDCLRINVFTKNLFKNSTVLKPVLVHIHGGAFRRGSGTSKTIEPYYIMEHDIVVVTFNYRIGALGFLALGTAECPGNAGFKDQVEALKWVRSHIGDFGGDRDQVTLSGHSAGSQSVTMHMTSPMSKVLFKQAIPMSGTACAQWEIPTHYLNLAKKQAEYFGCSTASPQAILNCLREQSAVELSTHDDLFYEYANSFPLVLWGPVIEPDFGQQRFLVESPTDSFLRENFSKVVTMAGMVKSEFARLAKIILENDQFRNEMENNFSYVAPIAFWYERDTERSEEISKKLKEEFFKNPLKWDESLADLQIPFGDGIISFGVHRLVDLIYNHIPTYYYLLSFVGRYSHFNYPGNLPFDIDHEDELQYLFRMPNIGPKIEFTDPENVMVQRMSTIWSNFVKYGEPNNPDDGLIEGKIQWLPYHKDVGNYLNIGSETNEQLTIEQYLFSERFAVWDELFPLNNEN